MRVIRFLGIFRPAIIFLKIKTINLIFEEYILINILNEKFDNLVGLQIEIVIEIHSESHFVYNILTYIHTAYYVCYFLVKTGFKGPNTIA